MNVRYVSIGPEFQLVTDRDNNVRFWQAELNWWTNFNTGDWWRMEFSHTHDVVEEAFEPSRKRGDVAIPAGTFDFSSFTVGPSPSRSRKFRPRVFFQAGTFYTGRRFSLSSEAVYQPTGRISLEMDLSSNWLRLPQANLNITALSTRILYSFTTDFFVKLFSQWNNDRQSVSTNFLLNWRYRPGSDVFLVFDNRFGTEGSWKRKNRSVLIKWSYLLGT